MVIGFDGSRAFSKDRTGTENYSYQLLKNLAKIDRENNYIVYIRPGVIANGVKQSRDSHATLGMTKKVTRDDKFQWPENFQFKTINWPRLWTQAGLALQTLKNPLDLLFVPAHTLPLIRKPGLKTVVTVHDLGAEYLPTMHQLKQRLYLNWITKFQLRSATKIIAVSKATKEDLIKKVGIKPVKVEVIYEGVDRKIFKPVRGETLRDSLKHYNLVPKTYFLFVGTIQPRKNLERLILAFHEFYLKNNTNLQLVLVGGKGWLSDEIYELPKKLGIEDKVKFLGRVEGEDLPALYSGALALTFPSLFEGFGLPILEAFASECPVITSNYSSMSEIASDSAFLVNPESVGEISKGMEFFLKEENRQDFIKKGLNRVKLFTWEKCARETLKVLQSCI